MEAKYKKPIYLTIHEDELLTGGNKKINCIIYIVARRNVLARTIIKVKYLQLFFYDESLIFCGKNLWGEYIQNIKYWTKKQTVKKLT